MDALALEASGKKAVNGAAAAAPLPAPAPVKRKPAKKAKKAVVFFEVEILDAKTKDKLCFLDKVRALFFSSCQLPHTALTSSLLEAVIYHNDCMCTFNCPCGHMFYLKQQVQCVGCCITVKHRRVCLCVMHFLEHSRAAVAVAPAVSQWGCCPVSVTLC